MADANLQLLFERAIRYSRSAMFEDGKITITVIGESDKEEIFYNAATSSKDASTEFMKLKAAFIAYNVQRYVLVGEVTALEVNGSLPPQISPELLQSGRDGVHILAIGRDESYAVFTPIIRNDDGSFYGFDFSGVMDTRTLKDCIVEMTGSATELLPPSDIQDGKREIAKQVIGLCADVIVSHINDSNSIFGKYVAMDDCEPSTGATMGASAGKTEEDRTSSWAEFMSKFTNRPIGSKD